MQFLFFKVVIDRVIPRMLDLLLASSLLIFCLLSSTIDNLSELWRWFPSQTPANRSRLLFTCQSDASSHSSSSSINRPQSTCWLLCRRKWLGGNL